MKDWLKCFDYDGTYTLEINGEVLSKEDIQNIGSGSQKQVYKIKGKNLCFFTSCVY